MKKLLTSLLLISALLLCLTAAYADAPQMLDDIPLMQDVSIPHNFSYTYEQTGSAITVRPSSLSSAWSLKAVVCNEDDSSWEVELTKTASDVWTGEIPPYADGECVLNTLTLCDENSTYSLCCSYDTQSVLTNWYIFKASSGARIDYNGEYYYYYTGYSLDESYFYDQNHELTEMLPVPALFFKNHQVEEEVNLFDDEPMILHISAPGAETITYTLFNEDQTAVYTASYTGDDFDLDIAPHIPGSGTYDLLINAEATGVLSNSERYTLYIFTVEDIASGDCGNGFSWTLNNKGLLTISGTGSMPDFSANSSPWAEYKYDTSSVMISSGITHIGNNAFTGFNWISVKIPSSVASIGDGAFSGCTNMGPVTYGGIVAEWANVEIGSNNNPLLYCIKHCSDGDVAAQTITGSIGDGVTYALTPEGILTVTGAGSWNNDAFYMNNSIISATLKSGVTEIGQSGFEFCENMVSIYIPATVTTIKSMAFDSCNVLTDVYYEGTEEQWNAIDIAESNLDYLNNNTLHYIGSVDPAATSGTLNAGGEWTLDENGVLTISGPAHVIGNVFNDIFCQQLTKVVFGPDVVEIGNAQFSTATQLTAFVVDSANPSYASDDGVLYNKDMTRLIEAPIQKTGSFTVPNSVTSISLNAFYNTQLSVVYIQEGVTSLPSTCFSGAENLSEIHLPASLTSIGFAAFDHTFALNNVYFAGSTSDWHNLSIGYFNDQLNSCIIHCSDDIISPPTKLRAPEIQQIVHGTHTGTDVTGHVTFPEGARMVHVEFGQYDLDGDEFYEKVSFDFDSESDFHILGLSITNAGTYQIRATAWTDETPAPDPYDSDTEIFAFELENGPFPSAPEVTLTGYDEIIEENDSTIYVLNLANHPELLPSVSYTISNASSYAFAWNQVNPVTSAVMSTSGTPTSVISGSSGTFHFEGGPGRYDLSFWRCDNGIWSWQNNICVELKPIGGYLPEPEITYRNHILWADNPVQIFPDESLEFTVSVPGAESITYILSEINNGIDDFIYSENRIGDESTFDLSSDVSFPGQYHLRFLADKAYWVSSDISIVLNLVTVETTDSGEFGTGFAWELNNKGVLTVSGTGSMPDFSSNSSPWAEYKYDTSSVMISSGITHIGNNAFTGFNWISVKIPSSVASIGDGAFSGCTNMGPVTYGGTVAEWANVEIGSNNNPLLYCIKHCSDGDVAAQTISGSIGNGVTYTLTPEGVLTVTGAGSWNNDAFYMNNSIISATLKSGVTEIGQSGFEFCENMVSIYIPVTVTTIKSMAFDSCNVLTDVYYEGTEEQWNAIDIAESNLDYLYGEHLHFNTVNTSVIASGTGDCGDGLSWTLDSNGLLTISGTGEMYSFPHSRPWDSYSSSIVSATIENGVTSIGNFTFYDCSALTSVIIPDSVTSIGKNAFENCTSLTSVTIPESVTSINEDAFNNCTGLTSVIIQNGLNSIGNDAFAYCTSLTSITIPDSVTSMSASAFYGCTSLTSIIVSPENTCYSFNDGVLFNKNQTELLFCLSSKSGNYVIPDSVTNIASGAFLNCELLTSVTIPNSVTSIGYRAFYCTDLTDVYYFGSEDEWSAITIGEDNESLTDATIHFNYTPGSETIASGTCGANGDNLTWTLDSNGLLTISGTGAMQGYGITSSDEGWITSASWGARPTSVVIEDGVTTIGKYAFYGCENLTGITIPDGVTTIGDGVFELCTSLTSITIPDSVTSIGGGAFDYCTGLTSISIPDGVTGIDETTFNNCRNLTSITIPDSVTSIGTRAFYGCSSLTNVTIPDSVTRIGNEAFNSCSGLTDMTIPDSVTSMGTYVFGGCSGLTSVRLSDSLTSIAAGTFAGCSSLASVTIPDGVTSMGGFVFNGCTSLTSVTIPDGVTGIGESAFQNCACLTSITIPDSVTSIAVYAFSGCTGLTDIYYTGSEEQWNAITIETGNDTLTSAQIHYNSSAPLPAPIITVTHGTLTGSEISGQVTIPDGAVAVYVTISHLEEDGQYQEIYNFCCNSYSNTFHLLGHSTHDPGTYQIKAFSWSHEFYSDDPEETALDSDAATYELTLEETSVPSAPEVTLSAYTLNLADFGDNVYPSVSYTIAGEDTEATAWSWELYSTVTEECEISQDLPDNAFPGNTGTLTMSRDPGRYEVCFWRRVNGIWSDYTMAIVTVNASESLDVPTVTYADEALVDNAVFSVDDQLIFTASCANAEEMNFQLNRVVGYDEDFVYSGNSLSSELTIDLTNENLSPGNYKLIVRAFHLEWNNSIIRINFSIGDGGTHSGTCGDGAAWTLEGNGVLTISGTGTTGNDEAPWYDYRLLITKAVIESGITAIGDHSFENCANLAEITIPEGVTYIGDCAFYDCKRLKNITLPSTLSSMGDGPFDGCGLTSISIPANITRITQFSFHNCTDLASVTIPESVTVIRNSAFADCTRLTDVYYSGSASQWAAIDIDEDGNDPLTSAQIHYNSSAPSLPAPTITVTGTRRQGMTISVTGPENAEAIDVYLEAKNASELASDTFSGSSGVLEIPGWVTVDDFTYVVTAVAKVSGGSGEDGWIYGEEAEYTFTLPEPTQPEPTVPDHMTFSAKEGISGEISMTVEGAEAIAYIAIYEGMGGGRPDESVEGSTVYLSAENDEYGSYEIYCWARFSGLWYGIGSDSVTILPTPTATWSIDENGVMTVSGTGMFNDQSWHEHYEDIITAVIINEGITGLGEEVFAYCNNLTSVTLPDGLTYIGELAFCQSPIQTVIVPAGVPTKTETYYSIKNSTSTEEVLFNVTLPATVTSARNSFWATNMPRIYPDFKVPAGLRTIDEEAFSGISASFVWLSDNTKTIGSKAFAGCTHLQYVRIPEGCTSIAIDAFPKTTVLLVPEYDTYASDFANQNGYTVIRMFLGGGNG